MKRELDETVFLIFMLIAGVALLFLVGTHQVFGQAPTTIIGPTGAPTFVYPPMMPSAPATVLPPKGQPSFVYPPIGAPIAPIVPVPYGR